MSNYNVEALLKKEKAELDKLKTALEIAQSEEKFVFEKRKFRTENVRLVAVALLTAVISLGSSYFIEFFKQQNNLKTEVQKEFFELKKSYISEKDANKRNEFACELAGFDNSIKVRVIENEKPKFDSICKSMSTIKALSNIIINTDTNSNKVQSAISNLKSLDKMIQDLKQQKQSAPANKQIEIAQEIKKLNSKSDSVINKTPEIKQAYSSTQDIEKNVKELQKIDVEVTSSADEKSGISAVAWFKEGYFLYFGEFRILLQYLDKKIGIQVEVCKTDLATPCVKPLLSKVWVKTDAPLQFSDETGANYRINLEAIDHAGKNPFTLAAYITFETLGKKQIIK